MARRKGLVKEFARKAVHLSGLSIVVGYTLLLNYFSQRVAILAMTALLILLLEVEHIRVEHKPKMANAINGLLRRHEQNNISGAVFLVISCVICFSAFDYWIAVAAMFMCVFGDLFAALFGKIFRTKKIHNNKTWPGTIAGLVTNVTVGMLVLPSSALLIIPMAITASVVEFITNKLDDNLTVPLFAGFVGQMIVYYMGIQLPAVNFWFLGWF